MEQAIYQRIAADMRRSIVAGEYKPDDLLPSENDLAKRYDTSRVTVRKSLHELEFEGLIKPWQGKGYFVQPPQHSSFNLIFGDSTADGRFRYQEVNILQPEKEIADALRLGRTQPAIVARRILERDGAAVAYDEKYIPYERGVPSIEFELHFVDFPDMFADRFPSMSLRTEMTIDIELPAERVFRALGLEERRELLTVSRLIITTEGRRVGYGKQYLTREYGPLTASSGLYKYSV